MCVCLRDEDAPAKIDDPDAMKPEGWLDDEPEFVPDPNAEKPEDWYINTFSTVPPKQSHNQHLNYDTVITLRQ